MAPKRIAGRKLQQRRQIALTIYGTNCYLCGHPLRFDVPHNNPHAYELDHVIPLTAGGTDTIDNWRPTHRVCNARKGQGPPTPPAPPSRRW